MTRMILFLATLGLAAPALADRDEHEHHEHHRGGALAKADPVWLKECGSCHVAYPAHMLSAPTWKRLMADLGKHFGSDASLTPEEQRRVTDYLVRNAGTPSTGETSLRITKTRWFLHEHGEVRASDWRRPGVKSPANCQACHADAAKGDFNEHAVRIPR